MIILLIIIHLPVLPLAGTAAALAPTTAGREARDDRAGQALEHTPVQLLHNELGLLHRRKSEQGRGYSHTRLGDDPRRHQGPEPGEDVADGLFFSFFPAFFFRFSFFLFVFSVFRFSLLSFFLFSFFSQIAVSSSSFGSPATKTVSEAIIRQQSPLAAYSDTRTQMATDDGDDDDDEHHPHDC